MKKNGLVSISPCFLPTWIYIKMVRVRIKRAVRVSSIPLTATENYQQPKSISSTKLLFVLECQKRDSVTKIHHQPWKKGDLVNVPPLRDEERQTHLYVLLHHSLCLNVLFISNAHIQTSLSGHMEKHEGLTQRHRAVPFPLPRKQLTVLRLNLKSLVSARSWTKQSPKCRMPWGPLLALASSRRLRMSSLLSHTK